MSDVAICMCFDGVRGESGLPPSFVQKSPASGGWMNLKGCSFSAALPAGQTEPWQDSSALDVTEITVTKLADASSTGLYRDALFGGFDSNVVIVFLRTGTAQPQQYLRLELLGCGIAGFTTISTGSDRPLESFSIRYTRMDITSWAFERSGASTARATATIANSL